MFGGLFGTELWFPLLSRRFHCLLLDCLGVSADRLLAGFFLPSRVQTDVLGMDLYTSPATANRTLLHTPEDFLRMLHPPGSRGYVSLLATAANGGVIARCYPPAEVDPVCRSGSRRPPISV